MNRMGILKDVVITCFLPNNNLQKRRNQRMASIPNLATQTTGDSAKF